MPIDTHVHLDAPEFDDDRAAVLDRARAAGVNGFVAPAVTADAWAGLAGLARDHPDIHPAIGLHPMYLDAHRPEQLDALERWIADTAPVAVGECGLDFFVDGLDRAAQNIYFERQLDVARAAGLPVIVHARRAVDAVIHAIRGRPGLSGVVHSFSGSAEQARQLHDLGFLLGFGGPITYDRATRLRGLVATLPLDQLLLETDAPDQPPADARGRRNEPAALTGLLATAATLRDVDAAGLSAAVDANARRLFRLDRRTRITSAASSAPDRH